MNWLCHPDMLPAGLPNARIMVFNHESQWYGEDAVSVRLDPLATSLISAIIEERKVAKSLVYITLTELKENAQDCPTRPLIIIGHSLGGLIVEKVLLCTPV